MKLRRKLRWLVAELLYRSGALPLYARLRGACSGSRICVLGFHRVLSTAEEPRSHSSAAIVMQEENFRATLAELKRNFQVVSLAELRQGLVPKRGRKPVCVITFDDGWSDNYTTAWPRLREQAVPATIFLVSGLVGERRTFWIERLLAAAEDENVRTRLHRCVPPNVINHEDVADIVEYFKHMPSSQRTATLKDLEPVAVDESGDLLLSWDAARQMLAAGGMEFGAHTETHPLLTYETAQRVEQELAESKGKIEQRLGVPVRAFAYPNGNWNETVRASVSRSGFECAFTTVPGWYRVGDDRFTIPRILLHDGSVCDEKGRFSAAMLMFTLLRYC